MPTADEVKAAAQAMRAAREKSRVSGGKWPSTEEEARIALEAAEKARSQR